MGIVARQSSKAAISNYLGILLGFVNLFVLLPLFYEPENLGATRLLLETGVVISSFALLGTNYSINRFFPFFKSSDQKHNGFFFWAFLLPLIGYFFVLIGLLFFKQPLLRLFTTDSRILNQLYPMLISLVFFSLFQTVLETCNSNHGRIAVPNFFREVILRILILGGGFLYFIGWVNYEVSVWIIVMSYGLVTLFNFFYLRTLTKIHLKPDFEFIKKNPEIGKDAFKFTLMLIIGSLTGLIAGKIDFLMISAKKSLVDTAIYSVGFYLALIIEIPKRTIQQISQPIISQHMKDGQLGTVEKMYKQITLNQLLVASILFFLIWLNIDNLYQIMPRGDFYKSGKTIVFLIGISKLLDMIGSASGPIIANSKYYWFSLTNFAVFVVVAVVSNTFLISNFGINGAAAAAIITMFFTHGTAILVIWNRLKIHPFSKNQFYIILVLLIFLIPTLWGKWFENPFIDGAVRTIVLGGPMIWLCYKLRLSEEFSHAVEKFLAQKLNIRIGKEKLQP